MIKIITLSSLGSEQGCVGENLGTFVVEIAFTQLVHYFDCPLHGMNGKELDMFQRNISLFYPISLL